MVVSSQKSDNVGTLKKEHDVLSSVIQYECLGMMLESKLSMTQQLDSMYKRANSKSTILCKIRRYISEKTSVIVYKTMIRPHLDYIDFVIDSC